MLLGGIDAPAWPQPHICIKQGPTFKQGNRRHHTSPPVRRLLPTTKSDSECVENSDYSRQHAAHVVIASTTRRMYDHYVKNTTSSTKPEVHDALRCRHRRTEPRTQSTRTEKFVMFGRVVFETCERTSDRQTHRRAHSNTSHRYPGGGAK